MSAGVHTEQTSCASCTFFDDATIRSSDDKGLCRANPPSGGNGHTAWPTVATHDWCGHFQFDGGKGAGVAAHA